MPSIQIDPLYEVDTSNLEVVRVGGGPAPLKTFIISSCTYDQDHPSDETQYRGALFTKGLNYTKYTDAVLARGVSSDDIVTASTTVEFRGTAMTHLLSMFPVVILQHAPHPDVIAAIKAKSVIGTKVCFWTSFEACAQSPCWSRWEDTLRNWLKMHYLEGTGANTHSETSVDVYETSSGDSNQAPIDGDGATTGVKPHSWQIDIFQQDTSSGFGYITGILHTAFGWFNGKLDGWLFDNVFSSPYYGTATNAPTPDGARQTLITAAWNNMLTFHNHGTYGYTWGNSGDMSVDKYSAVNLPGRWSEHFFRGADGDPAESITGAQASTKVLQAKTNGLRLAIGLTKDSRDSVTLWATGNETAWGVLKSNVNTHKAIDNTYVNNARSGQYLFWNKHLRSPQ